MIILLIIGVFVNEICYTAHEGTMMKTTGFICEFNPLHDGHKYFIQSARAATGADYLVAVMSGDYVQRGEPAVAPMHERARAALEAGCDLVLQLPVPWSTASALGFCEGGMRLLGDLGCIDSVCFGAETSDSSLLQELADLLEQHDAGIQSSIRRGLKDGMTYAAARTQAVMQELSGLEKPYDERVLTDLLTRPNNQLALGYLQSMIRLGLSIKPCSVQRDPSFAGSTTIRNQMSDTDRHNRHYLCADDFSLLLKDRLLSYSSDDLCAFADVSVPLANRIRNHRNEFTAWSDFAELLHTKEMTRARINRALLHIVLGIKKDDPLYHADASPDSVQTEQASFVRVLGFKKSAAPLLSLINEHSAVPVLTSLPPAADDYAGNLYQSVRASLYDLPYIESHQLQPVILG